MRLQLFSCLCLLSLAAHDNLVFTAEFSEFFSLFRLSVATVAVRCTWVSYIVSGHCIVGILRRLKQKVLRSADQVLRPTCMGIKLRVVAVLFSEKQWPDWRKRTRLWPQRHRVMPCTDAGYAKSYTSAVW